MRREGSSLREIASVLKVSLSTASVWVRDIPVAAPPPATTPRVDAEHSEAEPTGPPRHCSRCARSLPLSAFNKHPKGHQWWCRDCYREYFRKRGELHRQQSGAAKRRRTEAARRFVIQYKRQHPCVDCGQSNPVVLEFDHLQDKSGHLSVMAAMGLSVAALREEIAKCDVVCVNCHRRRTGRRAGWRRAAVRWWETAAPLRFETARNTAVAFNHLELSGCVDCGETDLCVLDFDHVGPKTGTVMQMARAGVGLPRLRAEIANCEVRCANCHRTKTVEELGHSIARG